mmetsp:Transcript_12136/g.10762  ORF Transcript_12136/g.10762 Transcript_12136/m.10762 type:complete len:115 (+) Transcript_12136:327-671(+)
MKLLNQENELQIKVIERTDAMIQKMMAEKELVLNRLEDRDQKIKKQKHKIIELFRSQNLANSRINKAENESKKLTLNVEKLNTIVDNLKKTITKRKAHEVSPDENRSKTQISQK